VSTDRLDKAGIALLLLAAGLGTRAQAGSIFPS
jgi:hypothetical protein